MQPQATQPQETIKTSPTARADKPAPQQEVRVLVPPVDVLESADAIVILCDLPGVKAANVSLHLEKDVLTLVAEREASATRKAARYKRTFQLPADLDGEGIEAKTERGVLAVRLPRRAASKPRQIVVSSP